MKRIIKFVKELLNVDVIAGCRGVHWMLMWILDVERSIRH